VSDADDTDARAVGGDEGRRFRRVRGEPLAVTLGVGTEPGLWGCGGEVTGGSRAEIEVVDISCHPFGKYIHNQL